MRRLKVTSSISRETVNQLVRIATLINRGDNRSAAIEAAAQFFIEAWADVNGIDKNTLIGYGEYLEDAVMRSSKHRLPNVAQMKAVSNERMKAILEHHDIKTSVVENAKKVRMEMTKNGPIDFSGLDE